MRSSKSRSRSKSNRQRSVGNIVNRVFDSSGPEGKVRGTPQQIIEKYTQLARDASLGNDRVAAENFQQHAEHYARMLGEAQREQDARREQQEQQGRDRQRERFENGSGNGNDQGSGNGNGGGSGRQQDRNFQGPESLQSVEAGSDQPDVFEDEIQSPPQPDLLIDTPETGDAAETDKSAETSGLVETPEGATKPRSRGRRPKAPAEENADGTAAGDGRRRSRAKKRTDEAEQAEPPQGTADPTEVAD